MTFIISIGFILIAHCIAPLVKGGNILWTIDIPSFFVMLITTFTVLIGSDSAMDFLKGIRMAVSKKSFLPLQLARSISAISLVIQSVLCACFMMVFLCIALILLLWEGKYRMGPILALGLVSILYAGEMLIILLSAKSVLRKKLSAFGGSPSDENVTMSKLPGKPYLVFAIGIPLLFLALSIDDIFLLSDYPATLVKLIPFMLLFLYGASYILLLAGKLLKTYFKALSIGCGTSCNDTRKQLEDYAHAVNFVIATRLALSFCAAVLISLITLGTLERGEELPFLLSIPVVLIGLTFLSVLFLFPLRCRIKKLIDFRCYGGTL